jgi:hypothetical protein
MARDDFSADVKDVLARRVGMRCSNPNCRQLTSGPQQNPRKVLNVGVAAHITAASRGGPRYASDLNAADRKSAENAIWLCQNCAKLIDNDPLIYSVDLLQQWKRLSEEAARLAIDSPATDSVGPISDSDVIRFYAQCFDRPAFLDPFMQEGSMEAFDKAIEDTITAINTGCLRARDGGVLERAKGKAFLRNADWREQMDVVVDLLRAIRSRYDIAIRLKQIHVSSHVDGRSWYCINDPTLAEWMDSTRAQVLETFARVAEAAGVHAQRFPRLRSRHW